MPPEPPQPEEHRAFALIIGEGVVSRVFEIHAAKVIIGSDPDCEIRLLPGECAPKQAELQRAGDKLLLLNLTEANGKTRVDGHAVEVAHLEGGERLTLGNRTARVQCRSIAPGVGDAPIVTHREYSRAVVEEAKSLAKRGPFFLISAVVHILLLLLLAQTTVEEPGEDGLSLHASLEEDDQGAPSEIPDDEPIELDDEPEAVEPPIEDPVVTENQPTDEPQGIEESPLSQIDFSAGMGAAPQGAINIGAASSAGFRSMVGKLRRKGLDLSIVFDSTGSMEDFLHEVKRDIAEMIDVVSVIVPDFQIGLVTFKGTPDFGPSSLRLNLTHDRYEVVNFLDSIDSRGGSSDARSGS